MRGDEVLGEIDIDSDRLAAFGATDQELLEAVAALLADADVRRESLRMSHTSSR